MVSLYQSIYNIISKSHDISNAELISMFESQRPESIRSMASKARKAILQEENLIDNINIEAIEKKVLRLINKQPTTHNIKLAIDILKLKQAEKGLDDDIDIEQYLLKAKRLLSIPDDELPHKELDEELD